MNLILKSELLMESDSGVKITSIVIELLRAVDKTGSLTLAVKEIGISYSYAWVIIFKLDCVFKPSIIGTHRGGKGGGQAWITENGKRLVAQYDMINNKINHYISEHKVIMIE